MRNAPARRHQGVDTGRRERLATVIQLGRLRGPPADAGPSAVPGRRQQPTVFGFGHNCRGIPSPGQIRRLARGAMSNARPVFVAENEA